MNLPLCPNPLNRYKELGQASAAFFSWLFIRDNVLVQINGDLPEDRARQYEEALATLN